MTIGAAAFGGETIDRFVLNVVPEDGAEVERQISPQDRRAPTAGTASVMGRSGLFTGGSALPWFTT